jgi:Kef-type K+ transport system membrane component KefB
MRATPAAIVRSYLLLVGLAIIAIAAILRIGESVPQRPSRVPAMPLAARSSGLPAPAVRPLHSEISSARQPASGDALTRLLLQLVVIISVSYLVGALFGRLGQPAVVGEMMAGIVLGPSLFGWVAPHAFEVVFAPGSLEPLRLLSQIGVCLFMFAVGMELDLSQIWRRAERILVIGHGSIAIPFLCGVALALPLYGRYANPGASFSAFALFMGISMSITAFPMLVRILKDRRLFQTSLGKTATMCAALGDATAWCILAFVIALAGAASLGSALLRTGAAFVFGGFMFVLIRPLLARLLQRWLGDDVDPQQPALVLVSAVVLGSALVTEWIGLHALFGAFLAGIVMPVAGSFRMKVTLRVEQFSSILLLPTFFAFIGLRTQAGLLTETRDWLVCGGIVVVATLGKMGGTALIARALEQKWREALALGALMNTRGLMELIALSIGLEMGILSMRIFTMLVLMAILTTVMTGPLVQWLATPVSAPVGSGMSPAVANEM